MYLRFEYHDFLQLSAYFSISLENAKKRWYRFIKLADEIGLNYSSKREISSIGTGKGSGSVEPGTRRFIRVDDPLWMDKLEAHYER